jgi:integrase
VASITKVNAGYRARWRSPDGASRSKTFKRKIDAENHLTSVEHSKLTGAYVDPRAGRVTFKTFAEEWRAAQVHRPGTASQIETNLRRHVYPRIGDRPIGAIRPSEILGLVKWLSSGDDERNPLSTATVEVVYTWVATIFKAAVLDMVIPKTPCQQVKLPAVEHKKVVPFSIETVEQLIDAVPDRYRALVVLGAGTGVRISEALGVTNDRIDWMRRTVTIDRQLIQSGGRSPIFGPVKDKRNRPRTIPLPQVVVDELSVHVAKYGLGPTDLLFTGGRGSAVSRQGFSETWMAAAGHLGIHQATGFTNCATSTPAC